MDLLRKYCKYIGEGNAHIVLSVTGTDYVFRLIKEDCETTDLQSVHANVAFIKRVMIPLLSPSNHVTAASFANSHKVPILPTRDYARYDVIEVPDFEVAAIMSKLEPSRPKKRIHKTKASKYIVQAPNYLIINPLSSANYCIEIKPKEAFIPSSLKASPKCFYCLKQFLKISEKQIDKISQYCPLDLFSGNKLRMRFALLSLIKNPQNNFKLFRNEQVIFDDKSSFKEFDEFLNTNDLFNNSMIAFIDFVIETLVSSNNECTVKLDRPEYEAIEYKKQRCMETHNLPSNCLLSKLRDVQTLSDKYDLASSHIDIKDKEYVCTILDEIKSQNLNLNNEGDKERFISNSNPLHLALISAVAKDCSVMISFSSDYLTEFPSVKIGDQNISYRVAVTDLEPKSVKSLLKKKELEKKMLKLHQEYWETAREDDMCKIQPHSETRAKQLEAWEQLVIDYLKASKQSTIDVRESQNSPLFNNSSINRKLSQESILTILEDMAKTGKAAPIDKSKAVWEVYWHSLDEWGNMVYNWACSNGLNNSVCTLFELREGDNTVDEEFHGLDMNVLVKALKTLEVRGKCELMDFDDSQGVKFF